MAIKPILFNTEMVRAILDGRKTCTRRIMKPQLTAHYGTQYVKPPYGPGDILYVRETWCALPVNEAGHMRGHSVYYYKADGDLRPEGWRGNWHPSIRMPKEAARIWLKVTDVRVERLQDITEDGAWQEGTDCWDDACYADNGWHPTFEDPDSGGNCDIIAGFEKLWNNTIKKSDLDRYGWSANPYVFVIEFERCEKPENL